MKARKIAENNPLVSNETVMPQIKTTGGGTFLEGSVQLG